MVSPVEPRHTSALSTHEVTASAADQNPYDPLTDAELEALITRVYNGEISRFDMPTALSNARTFMHGVFQGYGGNFDNIAWGTPDYIKLAHLERNVYQFSGAKNYHQLRDLTSAIKEGDKVLPFSEFKVKAMAILDEYQGSWLRTEYNAAIAGSQMASKWVQFEKAGASKAKGVSKLLTYRTMEDARVRPEHAAMDGITLPIDHVFWQTRYPPNGWNCRCTVLRRNDTIQTAEKDVVYADIPKMFQTNLGQAGLVFPKGSAYFMGIPKDVKADINSIIPDHPQPKNKK